MVFYDPFLIVPPRLVDKLQWGVGIFSVVTGMKSCILTLILTSTPELTGGRFALAATSETSGATNYKSFNHLIGRTRAKPFFILNQPFPKDFCTKPLLFTKEYREMTFIVIS
jgi:hypothetical protein